MPDYEQIVRVGVDLAHAVVQVHAVDSSGKPLVTKQLQRSALMPWCKKLPAGCLVAFEACSAAHHLARQLLEAGLEPRLIAPAFVSPYRMAGPSGKNDANDAEAICEAACRPRMRFVNVKTPEQQGWMAIHRLRDGYVKDRTACINRLKGILFEFGITLPPSGPGFRQALTAVLAKRRSEVPAHAVAALRKCRAHLDAVERQVAWCDKQILRHARTDENAKAALQVRGVGPISASALAASVGNLSQFGSDRQFGAWLGLVPRQSSSGGKQKLGRITKRGDGYLRKLLILGAKSALAVAANHDDPTARWAQQLRERVGWPKACVALANRNARTLWRMLARPATAAARRVPGQVEPGRKEEAA